MNELRIAPVETQDLAQIAAIEAASITDGWSLSSFEDALANPQALMLAAADGGHIAGYVVCYHAADEGEIPTIAVTEDYRRRGIATQLLDELCREVSRIGVKNIYLEVRESNAPARAFYAARGFTETGKRPHFYEHPREDAIEMRLAISATVVA